MNKISGLILLACISINVRCSDNTETPTDEPVLEIETSPSAKVEDDEKSSGVYKGAFVGSSGYFKLVLNQTSIVGLIMIDDKGYDLTTTDITASNLGSAISDAVFKDALNTVSLTFSVNADGTNPTVELQIAGHGTIDATVSKEKSDAQILIYQGFEYSPNIESGVQCKTQLNLMLSLGTDSAAWSTYKMVDGFPLNNGNIGSCVSASGVGHYTYYISNNNILGIQFGSPMIFSNNLASWSEAEIYSITSFTYEDFDYSDSTRLARKL